MQSYIREKIENISQKSITTNPYYASGVVINASDLIQEFENSPWVKSTLSLNLSESLYWAGRKQASKVGYAIQFKDVENGDYRIALQPKNTTNMLPSNSGKTGSGESESTQVEINFGAGKIISPTIISSSTTKFPIHSTMDNKSTDVAPVVNNDGNVVAPDPLTYSTTQGGPNLTGTIGVHPQDLRPYEIGGSDNIIPTL